MATISPLIKIYRAGCTALQYVALESTGIQCRAAGAFQGFNLQISDFSSCATCRACISLSTQEEKVKVTI